MKQAPQQSGTTKAGSALLVVLVMLGLVAILAAVVSRAISGAALEMSNARMLALSEADLHAGIELGVGAILKLGDTMRSADAVADLPNRHLTVHITNERARIDLNVASKAALTALFTAASVDENEAEALATAVRDWRGGSASQKLTAPPSGAATGVHLPGLGTFDTPVEDQTNQPNQTIGTRYFMHPAQLASVPGFSRQMVKAVLPLVTLANGSNQIDPFIASQGVLEALPLATPSQVEGFLDARDGNTSRSMALLLLGVDKALLTDTAAVGWRLQIVSASRTGRASRREAVVVVGKGDDKPYRVLYVSDREVLGSGIASGR